MSLTRRGDSYECGLCPSSRSLQLHRLHLRRWGVALVNDSKCFLRGSALRSTELLKFCIAARCTVRASIYGRPVAAYTLCSRAGPHSKKLQSKYAFSAPLTAMQFIISTASNRFRMHLLNNLIREGSFIKTRARYQGLSPSARDLIEGLMCKDVDQRLTVQQAFKHPWL